jgi:excisionase family DNA binding protein
MSAHQHSTHPAVHDGSAPAALAPQLAADYLSVSKQTIYRLIAAGSIRAFKIGRSTRIPVADLDALIGGTS